MNHSDRAREVWAEIFIAVGNMDDMLQEQCIRMITEALESVESEALSRVELPSKEAIELAVKQHSKMHFTEGTRNSRTFHFRQGMNWLYSNLKLKPNVEPISNEELYKLAVTADGEGVDFSYVDGYRAAEARILKGGV